MRAIVIGGLGGMGQGVARDLIKQEKITKVTLGDINIDPARVQEKLRASDKVSLARIDVNDHQVLVDAIREHESSFKRAPLKLQGQPLLKSSYMGF